MGRETERYGDMVKGLALKRSRNASSVLVSGRQQYGIDANGDDFKDEVVLI